MKLNDLLGKAEYSTNIVLYESSTNLWDASKETLIKKDINICDYYNPLRTNLYAKYGEYRVIGITTEENALRITIYKKNKSE